MLPSFAWRPAAAVLLLLLHAGLLVGGLRRNFVTVDEVGHVPSGLSHWRTGDFAMYRVNPPLPRMLATAPLLVAGAQTNDEPRADVPGLRPEWEAGPAFAEANGPRYFGLVCLARWAGVPWSLLGGWLVYRWAGELYGGGAGLLSLALWCFSPNVMAHAELVTPDVPATVAGLAATYAFWHYLRRPSWEGAWFVGLLLGVAQLTKFTLLVLYGVWPVLALCFWWRGAAAPGRAAALGQGLLVLALSVAVLNLGYAYRGTGRPLGEFRFVSKLFAGERGTDGGARTRAGNRFRGKWVGRVPVPLPADYVLGIDVQRRDFESNWPCYLGGEWRNEGRWYFYLYALGVKAPLGALALVLGGLALALVRWGGRAGWRDDLAVWLPAFAVLALVSAQTGLQYLRYALPLLPFAFVGAGKLVRFARGRAAGLAAFGLVLCSAASSLCAWPHSLAYFNEAAGGPENGSRHLIDSNLDWGQDLLYLKEWLDAHPDEGRLGLAYANHVDPRIVGIEFDLPPWGEGGGPRPGLYAVSANFMRGMSFVAPDGRGRFRVVPPHAYAYFAQFAPVARAGQTIFIYRIAPEEASRAVRQERSAPPGRER